MLNNEPAPLSHNVFTQQLRSSNGQQPRSGVGQDKGAASRARIALKQPAPPQNLSSPQSLDINSYRAQKTNSSRVKLVHMTFWVHPLVKAELQRIAGREGASVSSIGASLLEQAIQRDIHSQYNALIPVIIEQAIRKHMRSYSSRIAVLLVRSLFASEQTRGMVTNILSRQPGVTPEILTTILDGSSKTAKGNIVRVTPQLAELIKHIEQWIQQGENTHD